MKPVMARVDGGFMVFGRNTRMAHCQWRFASSPAGPDYAPSLYYKRAAREAKIIVS